MDRITAKTPRTRRTNVVGTARRAVRTRRRRIPTYESALPGCPSGATLPQPLPSAVTKLLVQASLSLLRPYARWQSIFQWDSTSQSG
jgi:hypothetical protein